MFSLRFSPPYPGLGEEIVQMSPNAESAVMEFCLSPQDVPSFLKVIEVRGFVSAFSSNRQLLNIVCSFFRRA
jgi:hypothetical protein